MVGVVVSEKTDGPEAQWRTLRGLVDAVIAATRARPDRITFKRPEAGAVGLRATWLHPSRSLEVFVGDAHAGYLTLLHPAAARALDLRRPTALAELDLDLLLAEGEGATRYTPLPRFPAVPFDVAFEVPVALPTAAVADAIRRGAAGAPLRDLSWMSSFPLPNGTRSDAYHLVFRLDDRSLTSDEVAGFTKGIVAAVAELGGVLRS
jgi:phenylalanyl-tRNA synthetase beta chain